MKTRLKIIIPALIMIVLTIFAVWYFSGWKQPSDIDRIEIETGSYLSEYSNTYIVDFKSNTVTSISTYNDSKRVMHFSEEDKKDLVRKANMCRFFQWEESYTSTEYKEINDYKYFLTVYNDGSRHETRCDNAYPPEYREFWHYFLDTFVI